SGSSTSWPPGSREIQVFNPFSLSHPFSLSVGGARAAAEQGRRGASSTSHIMAGRTRAGRRIQGRQARCSPPGQLRPKAMARRRRVRKIRRTLPAGDGCAATAAELPPRHGGCELAARSPFRELMLGGGDGTELLQVSSILY
ncbi:unnamed protein product, partial [Urochloa humidicola]